MKYEYGSLVEWYGQGKSTFSDRSLSQYHFIRQKFHTDWSVIEPAPSQWELVIQRLRRMWSSNDSDFCIVTPLWNLDSYQTFRRCWCYLHLHDRRYEYSLNIDRHENFESHIVVFLRKAAVLLFRLEDGGRMFELLLVFYQTAWLHIPGDTVVVLIRLLLKHARVTFVFIIPDVRFTKKISKGTDMVSACFFSCNK